MQLRTVKPCSKEKEGNGFFSPTPERKILKLLSVCVQEREREKGGGVLAAPLQLLIIIFFDLERERLPLERLRLRLLGDLKFKPKKTPNQRILKKTSFIFILIF